MENIKQTDFRRKTSQLIDKIRKERSYTFEEIAGILGVTLKVISEWYNKKSSPRLKNFQKLKELAEGINPQKTSELKLPGAPPDDLIKKHQELITEAPGRFRQLTEQVFLLQSQNGEQEKRIKTLETQLQEVLKKISALSEGIGESKESQSDRSGTNRSQAG